MKYAEQKFKIYDIAINKMLHLTKIKILKQIVKAKKTYSTKISDKIDVSTPLIAFHLNGNKTNDDCGLIELGLVESLGQEKGREMLGATEFGKYVCNNIMYQQTFEEWIED